jgi:hypothetical protein
VTLRAAWPATCSSPPTPLGPPYRSYPGLWEKAHNKVAGQWDVDAWAAYLDYKAGNAPYVPLVDPKETDEEKRAREDEICKRSGLSREQLGFK